MRRPAAFLALATALAIASPPALAAAPGLRGELPPKAAAPAPPQSPPQSRQAQLDLLNARQAALRAETGQAQAQLSRLLAALELYRREPPPALLTNPRSAQDAVRAAILVSAIEPELRARVAALTAETLSLQQQRRALLTANEDLLTSESDLAEDRDEPPAGPLRGSPAVPAAPVVAAQAGPGPTSLLAPVAGALVRRFGQAGADGLTWRTAPGAVVRAPAAGVVEFSGPNKGSGEVLIFDLGGDYRLVLAGLGRVSAPAGRRLGAGQPVASMGASASPELYLELRKSGAPVDPTRWLHGSGAVRP